MSWLSGLAKGAEALLEKVDQTTASALQKDELQDDSNLPMPTFKSVEETTSVGQEKPSSFGIESKPETERMSASFAKSIHRSSSAKHLKQDTDEQLFEFLNSGPSSANGFDRKTPPLTSTPMSYKQQLNVKAVVLPKTTSVDIESETKTAEEEIPAQKIDIETKKEDSPVDFERQINDADGKDSQGAKSEMAERSDRVSNLQLENRLLKGEIASLNEELVNALKRVKAAEEGSQHLEAKLDHAQNQLLQQDRIVRGIEEKERDLNEALKAKDSQLAVLRVRMQEADDELTSKREIMEKLTADNQRILKDHTDSTGLQNVALDSFKEKLEEKEKEIKDLQIDFSKSQRETMELREKLQTEQFQMAESVKSLQLKLNEEKGIVKDMDQNLRTAKNSAEAAQRDLKEYKDKATRILQAKEKLITSLKQGSASTDTTPSVFTEIEELKHERDFLREELQQSKFKLEQLRAELYDIEQQSQSEADEHQQQMDNLEKSLQDENSKRQHFEEELTRVSQELFLAKEDLHRQMTKSSTALQERDAEIKRLNHQMNLKSTVSPSQEELENRVHAITDNLIQKQTLIETLSTEKNSLSLQLERLEQQYRDVQQHITKSNTHIRHSHANLDLEDSDEAHSRSIASIMPSGVRQSQRWKSTVNVIDKFSIRLGVFLRRYPAARLFVIVYGFLLHLWVTVVLLTYQPEIHTKNSKLPDHNM